MRAARAKLLAPRVRQTHRTRPWSTISAVIFGCAVLALVLLHVASEDNPVTDALSVLAFTTESGWLLQTTAVCMAVGSLTTLGALGAAALPTRGMPSILLTCWAAGLTLSAVFRANIDFHHAPVGGAVHRWAAAVAFLSLPAAGFALAARLRGIAALASSRRTLRRACVSSTGGLVIFGILYLLPESLTWLPVGLTQRVTLLCYLLVLAIMLRVASRAERLSPDTGRDGTR